MKKRLFLCAFLLLTSLMGSASVIDSIQYPIIKSTHYTIYLHPSGNDNQSGDSLNPVKTFRTAIDRIDSLSKTMSGHIYAQVVLFPGTYYQAIEQSPQLYQKNGKFFNISVRGKGTVQLDGTSLSLSAGSAMVALLGSHISVKNLEVLYSPANGIKFGWNYAGHIVNSHDILVDDVEIAQTSGHGIIAGVGIVNAGKPSKFVPYGERMWFKNCVVHDAVNYGDRSKSPWGSAIKFNNVKYGVMQNCKAFDNGGEGLDIDYCKYILIEENESHDNRANYYLDKAQGVVLRNNLSSNSKYKEVGILLSMEVYSALHSNFYMTNIHIYNNVILNASSAISFWQGTVSAIQTAHFSDIHIKHNTIIGKRKSAHGLIHFSYGVFQGKPVPNVKFSRMSLESNIVSVSVDSLGGNLIHNPLPQIPATTFGKNMWNQKPNMAYNENTDVVRSGLITTLKRSDLQKLIPHEKHNPIMIYTVSRDQNILSDYHILPRFRDSTNVGAFEEEKLSSDGNELSSKEQSVRIYPNPSNGLFIAELDISSAAQLRLSLCDLSGRELPFDWNRTGSQIEITLQTAHSGLGYLTIIANQTRVVRPIYFRE